MERFIYTVAIAQLCSDDPKIYNCILWGYTEKEAVDKLNDFFLEEKKEGHPVTDDDGNDISFESLNEINGLNTTDVYGDRQYDLVTAKIKIQ